jgi:AraC-like DNA-binding protein
VEQAVDTFKHLLKQLFAERGCDEVQIEFAYENDQPVGPACLYDRILRDSAWPTPQTFVEGTEKKKSRQQIVEEIEAIIREKYNMSLTIESIARMIHFTPNYIGTTFKTVRRISIGRYLTQVRLQRAEELLRNPLIQIGDIAIMCGYENITYFHTIFKKERGITPSEYRQKLSIAVKS